VLKAACAVGAVILVARAFPFIAGARGAVLTAQQHISVSVCAAKVPMWLESAERRDTHSESPQVKVTALQHGLAVPKQVALLCWGPQKPSVARSGSKTVTGVLTTKRRFSPVYSRERRPGKKTQTHIRRRSIR
jgi:hypothetical protein